MGNLARTPAYEREERAKREREAQERFAKMEAFLEAKARHLSVQRACAEAQVARQTVYSWRRDYPDFATRWDEATNDAVDVLEESAYQRALRRSDALAMFFLRSHRRETYGDVVKQETEHSGEVGIRFLPMRARPPAAGDEEGSV